MSLIIVTIVITVVVVVIGSSDEENSLLTETEDPMSVEHPCMRLLRELSEPRALGAGGGLLHLEGEEPIATMTIPAWLLHLQPPLFGYPELIVCSSLPAPL